MLGGGGEEEEPALVPHVHCEIFFFFFVSKCKDIDIKSNFILLRFYGGKCFI